MDGDVRLKRVLEAAAKAPGNQARFIAAGINTQVSNWYDAFLQLSPVDKQTVRQNPGLFLADARDVVYRGSTSGSRGQSFVYFAGKEWNQARIEARRQSLSWWGIDDNTPIINVASRLLPIRSVDLAIAGTIDLDFIRQLLALMRERPCVLRGYPSRLCEVASYLVSAPPVIAIICTGECLFDYQKALLQDVFQAPVINEYGCQETGISGLTCPQANRLHLDSDRCLYEIIDGQLVTTDLYNYTMPLVRYKCGDVLQLDSGCTCDRPGLTAKILGRIEDKITTLSGSKYPGEIVMPQFDGIATYQVAKTNDNRLNIAICPTDEPNLAPLGKWVNNTFGNIPVQVFVDNLQNLDNLPKRSYDDASWIDSVTQKPWANWLYQPLSFTGEGKNIAQLLQQLVASTVIVNSGIAPTTKVLLDEIIASPRDRNPALERIKARVLLFACSFLDDASLYNQAAQRADTSDRATSIDLLVPTLYLDAVNPNLNVDLEGKLDTFNVHHLLYSFELAIRKATSPIVKQRLLPSLAVLMGDLNFFASRFGVWLLAAWFELLRGKPFPQLVSVPSDDFSLAWLAWRKAIMNSEKSSYTLCQLQEAAKTPDEKARVYLEKGYGLLLAGEELNPYEWLEIIKANTTPLPDFLQHTNNIDITPWLPIVRSLCSPLLAVGDREMAYQCLVASAPPSSRISAFEQIAFQVNDKQSVIFDENM
ncbi:phenylacetate--CoA ligase family protein [Aliterella atlantica]|uniref:AMP-dependent synthetase/ligase domain-containing protein n=1 Tax=Aliterella atlantica CENA595 TaxID=1618023 RepID=A0A0D8ZY42_9CYAN|nr:hypothetical protein [Aliterella atlantica]KJH73374.1 hypothetical protein UH38_00915 [Aliterella atlantica CENA595]